MRKTYLMLAFGVLLTYSATAQSTANPDAPPPPVRQNEGPIKVLDAPPRKSEDPQRPLQHLIKSVWEAVLARCRLVLLQVSEFHQ